MSMVWVPPLVIFLGLVLAVTLWLTRPALRCPECDSKEVQLIKKEPAGLDHASWGGGGSSGGWGGARVYYEVSYRCNRCGETWSTRISETN